MNQLAAFRDTIALAEERGLQRAPGSEIGLDHLKDMYDRAKVFQGGWETFSEAKLGRWLGWAQCAVVAGGVGVTLEDMKRINMSHT